MRTKKQKQQKNDSFVDSSSNTLLADASSSIEDENFSSEMNSDVPEDSSAEDTDTYKSDSISEESPTVACILLLL